MPLYFEIDIKETEIEPKQMIPFCFLIPAL